MQMAKLSGIRTVPFALVRMNGQYAYLTRRIDRRSTERIRHPHRYHAPMQHFLHDMSLPKQALDISMVCFGRLISQFGMA